MKQKLIAVASAALIGLAAVATPNKVEAHSGGWWIPGAVIGGLALGAAIASGPGYYGYGYDPYYYGGGPYYYGGGPYYYGGGPYYGRRCWWRNGYRVCRRW
jgi:hypothetical protein